MHVRAAVGDDHRADLLGPRVGRVTGFREGTCSGEAFGPVVLLITELDRRPGSL
jgi:hypothetical protein